MAQTNSLQVYSLPPVIKKWLVVFVVNFFVTILLLIALTVIGNQAALSLLGLSHNAFDPLNTQVLPLAIVTIVTSSKLQFFFLVLLFFSKRIFILSYLQNTDLKKSMLWIVHPSVMVSILFGSLLWSLVVVSGLLFFIIPGLLMAWLMINWPFILTSRKNGSWRSILVGMSEMWLHKQSFWKSGMVMATLQILLLLGTMLSILQLANASVFLSVLVFTIVFFSADFFYWLWSKKYNSSVLPSSEVSLPKWILFIMLMSIVWVVAASLFFVKVLVGINLSASIRHQLVYDLLPPADVQYLQSWQQQITAQSKDEELTPEQQQNLESLVVQMVEEYEKRIASPSGNATQSATQKK